MIPDILIGTNGLSSDQLKSLCLPLLDEHFLAFDTAPNYNAEEALGTTVNYLLRECGKSRESVFVQTKLEWIEQKNNRIEEAFHESLARLGVEYIDSYLMHWPYPDTFDRDWKVFEKLQKHGYVRYIGVCNFRMRHWHLLMNSDIEMIPQINQIEIHPFRICRDLVDFSFSNGINVQAYSPICKMIPPIRNNEVLIGLAQKYGVSVPELILAWHVNRGVSPITKSSKPDRLRNNVIKALGLKLDVDDIYSINSLNKDYKYFLESWGCPGF